MRFGVHPGRRIEFYVRNGLVEKAPTLEQLKKASRRNIYAAGPVERFRFYIGHPLDLFPTKAKKQYLRRMKVKATSKIVESKEPEATVVASKVRGNSNGDDTPKPLGDRILTYTFQFSPARFAVQCYFNPWNAGLGTGLTIPLKYLIAHVVHAPHPSALWDVQIIHTDWEGLDQLKREIELAATGCGLKPHIYRALVQDINYYDYLRDLVSRVQRFDYPPPPSGRDPIYENLVNFLNYAVTL